LCKTGCVVRREEEVSFKQRTDRGWVHCRVTVPIGRCEQCDAMEFDDGTEAVIEAAVRAAYDKLPPRRGRGW
jgi:hypothetical protein